MKIFDLFKRKKAEPEPEAEAVIGGVFSTDMGDIAKPGHRERIQARIDELLNIPMPGPQGTMDSAIIGSPRSPKQSYMQTMPDAQLYWYASQGNIGPFLSSIIAQHWLVDKACSEPARDFIRQGWAVDCDDDAANEMIEEINDDDNALESQLIEFIRMGRVHGGRVAYLRIETDDPEFYRKPFNLDGVAVGGETYKGIVQIDAEHVIPLPTDSNLNDPAAPGYFKPTFFQIGQAVFHRSHLYFYIPYPVANRLKPAYNYFGASVPQRVYERVYGAERTANEAPQLAMTKRLVSVGVSEDALDSPDKLRAGMEFFAETRDNYGVYAHGKEESITQQDTSLADLDAVIMTQYQIVAAAASMPATKLLGTSPKGFGASGEYEEAVYRETLEGIQSDVTPLMRMHYRVSLRAKGVPASVRIKWNALDSPTAAEWASINLQKAQTAGMLIDKLIIDSEDARIALGKDENSDFFGINNEEEVSLEIEAPEELGA